MFWVIKSGGPYREHTPIQPPPLLDYRSQGNPSLSLVTTGCFSVFGAAREKATNKASVKSEKKTEDPFVKPGMEVLAMRSHLCAYRRKRNRSRTSFLLLFSSYLGDVAVWGSYLVEGTKKFSIIVGFQTPVGLPSAVEGKMESKKMVQGPTKVGIEQYYFLGFCRIPLDLCIYPYRPRH